MPTSFSISHRERFYIICPTKLKWITSILFHLYRFIGCSTSVSNDLNISHFYDHDISRIRQFYAFVFAGFVDRLHRNEHKSRPISHQTMGYFLNFPAECTSHLLCLCRYVFLLITCLCQFFARYLWNHQLLSYLNQK